MRLGFRKGDAIAQALFLSLEVLTAVLPGFRERQLTSEPTRLSLDQGVEQRVGLKNGTVHSHGGCLCIFPFGFSRNNQSEAPSYGLKAGTASGLQSSVGLKQKVHRVWLPRSGPESRGRQWLWLRHALLWHCRTWGTLLGACLVLAEELEFDRSRGVSLELSGRPGPRAEGEEG